ncbi:MAG: hypothetical protein OHK0056_05350 [Bacteriovoracaceae bacterium]
MSRGSSNLDVNLKYDLYEKSVQNPQNDMEFLNQEFVRLRDRQAFTLREDFAGTGMLACKWASQSKEHFSWAVDLDPEPIKIGKERHWSKLGHDERERVRYVEGNVLNSYDFKTDITVAFNFSYFVFKKRSQLLDYFKAARAGLKPDGLFAVDIFGGTECYQELEEETEHDGHSYFWDCDKFNPLNNHCTYYIHFKTHHDNKKHLKVFHYDWRHWSIPEIVDIMEEAGFSRVITYWEGTDENGEGDGIFYEAQNEENCESWVTYIVGLC